MKKIAIEKWTQLIANLGVIAGIVFLAVEIGQNRASLEESNRISIVNTRYEALQNFNQLRYLMLEQEGLAEYLTSDISFQDLGPADLRRLDSYCGITIWNGATAYETFRALGDDTAADGAVETIRSALGNNELTAACWLRFRNRLPRWGYEEFVEAVETR